jgi:anti-anti-sigma regulatory factor
MMAGYRTICDDGALRVRVAGDPPHVTVAGEIDEATYPGLVDALEATAADQREVHVHLREVVYCDLAGLRAIVRLAGPGMRGGAAGRQVVLHGLSAHLTAVLRILGWDLIPGLTIAPGAAGPGAEGARSAGAPAGHAQNAAEQAAAHWRR